MQQMSFIIKDMETYRNKEEELTEMKNAFDRLVSRQGITEEGISALEMAMVTSNGKRRLKKAG